MNLNNEEQHFARFYLERLSEKPSFEEMFPAKQWKVIMTESESLDIGFHRTKEITSFVEAILVDNNGSLGRAQAKLEEAIIINSSNEESSTGVELRRLSNSELREINPNTIFGKPNPNSIRKSEIYSKRRIVILRDENGTNHELESLLDEMLEFEIIIDNLLMTTSQVSDKIGLLNNEFQEVSSELIKYGLDSKKHGTKLILAGAGLSIASELYFSYKQNRLKKKIALQRKELMLAKRSLAEEKLEFIESIMNRFTSKSDKFKKLYLKTFDKNIQVNSPTRNLEIETFKKSFFLYIKYLYVLAVSNFIIEEMKAWLNNKENSSAEQPTIESIIDIEISEWVPKLIKNGNFKSLKWDNFINDIIENEKDSYIPPIYLLFSDPFFLRNYIGVDLPGLNNVEDGYIKNIKYNIENKYTVNSGPEKQKIQNIANPIQEMLNFNDYYLDCKILANEYKQDSPQEFGPEHVIISLVLGIPIFFGAKYIWSNLYGWVFAIVSMILVIIMSSIRSSLSDSFYEDYNKTNIEIKRVNSLELEKASKYRKIKI